MVPRASSDTDSQSERAAKAAIARRIGIRIRELRRAHKLTQEDLASRTSRSVDTISALERGLALPGFDTLTRLAEALDVSVGILFGYERPNDSDRRVSLMTRLLGHAEHLSDEQLAIAVAQIAVLAGVSSASAKEGSIRQAPR